MPKKPSVPPPDANPRHTLNQVELVAAILKAIDRQGVKMVEAHIINACIDAANRIIAACERPLVLTSPGMGLEAWLKCDDTGLSSRFMAYALGVMPLGAKGATPHYPHDPDDFGRCYRLLRAVPELRPKLRKMAEFGGAVWAAYIERWDEMERLYEAALASGTNKAPELFKMMQDIQAAACGKEGTSNEAD